MQPVGIRALFVGVNPSKAGAEVEDQTTSKWRGFSLRNGIREYDAVNPFGLCATDVRELAGASDPVGPDNLTHVMAAIADADLVVPCWGSRAKLPRELRLYLARMKRTIFESGKPIRIFGLTKSGDPMHPLMLGYDTPLIEWKDAV